MSDKLDRLAHLAGIEEGWHDFFGNWRPVSAETKRAFLAAMGFAVEDDEALARSLDEFENRPWRRWLEPVQVIVQGQGAAEVTVTLPADRDDVEFRWELVEELDIRHGGTFRPATLPMLEEREVDGRLCRRRLLRLPGLPGPGYHVLRLTQGEDEASMDFIVAPPSAYLPKALEEGRVWGFATQLYALRSERNWGCGDYTDLGDLMRVAGRLGAAAVGVNPLHALFPNQPHRFSPYAPSSRLFVNIAYLDVEAIEDFAECQKARRLVAAPAFQGRLSEMRNAELVDYVGVASLKRPVLEALWESFREKHIAQDSPRAFAFAEYQRKGGWKMEQFATFEALQEHFLEQGPEMGWWRRWPQEFQDSHSQAVDEFRESHADRVGFYLYLQWQADLQLAAAHAACMEYDMPVGLYRDLGVGIADDGAEAWSQQTLLSLGVTVGAPPDQLNLKGQDWGLAPFNPIAMREDCYRPFIAVLQANMRHAGAMRLDHAMSLQRLYWIPRGSSADQGAYVRFPVADLFALVALESRRNRCLVIGEDLGTVPEGFRERMQAARLLAYRLLYFERRDDATFKEPGEFPDLALVAVGTHDLPALKAWWNDYDLELRERLDLYPKPEMAPEERRGRQQDRERLVWALRCQGLLPDDFPTGRDLDDGQIQALQQAAHAFVDRTPSKLMMVQIEDVLGAEIQMNMPGTTDQHPNWRIRLPLTVEEIGRDERFAGMARRLLEGRCPAPQRDKVALS